MPRPLRFIKPGASLHIIQRGHNREPTFRSLEDFVRYRETLGEASGKFGCAIHAYVFMTNHVHLLVTPDNEHGPSRMMQAVGRRFARLVNLRYGRTGALWEGRFRSSLIDSDRYFLTCSRYIELNPVRAHMVDAPEHYTWSSYRRNAHGLPDNLVSPHQLYHDLGDNPKGQQIGYRALFQNDLDSETIERIRAAVNLGTVLGEDAFVDDLQTFANRRLARRAHGGDRRSPAFRGHSRGLTP
jgi:putative transposase